MGRTVRENRGVRGRRAGGGLCSGCRLEPGPPRPARPSGCSLLSGTSGGRCHPLPWEPLRLLQPLLRVQLLPSALPRPSAGSALGGAPLGGSLALALSPSLCLYVSLSVSLPHSRKQNAPVPGPRRRPACRPVLPPSGCERSRSGLAQGHLLGAHSISVCDSQSCVRSRGPKRH